MFFLPPSGVVLVQILGGLTVVIGLCLGWAWGAITMKAALATRPASDLQAQYAALQASNTPNTTNVDAASGQAQFTQIRIFEGAMLDTRVSVTYFCMMSLFIYLFARMRIAAPKLALVSIFGTIVADIYLVIAPLIPAFQGTIPKTMIIPCGIAIGVGALCNIVLFPQSTSPIVLHGMSETFVQMRGFGKALGLHLQDQDKHFDIKRLMKLRDGLLASYKSVDDAIKFLPMDFSYGKWSPQDIGSLHEPFRQMFVAFGELLQVPMFREQGRMKADMLRKVSPDGHKSSADAEEDTRTENADDMGKKSSKKRKKDAKVPKTKVATHQIARTIGLHEHLHHPDVETMTRQTFQELSQSLSVLLPTWREASLYVAASISQSTSRSNMRNSGEILKDLHHAQAEFEATAGKALVELHEHLLDADGNIIEDETGHHPPLLGLMTGLLYVERITNCAKATSVLLEKIAELDTTRQKSRLWLPKGLAKLFSWALSEDAAPNTVQGLQRTTTASSKPKKSRR